MNSRATRRSKMCSTTPAEFLAAALDHITIERIDAKGNAIR